MSESETNVEEGGTGHDIVVQTTRRPPHIAPQKGPLCSTHILIVRSSERNRVKFPSPSRYTIPLGSVFNVYTLNVLQVALPTTPMTIEAPPSTCARNKPQCFPIDAPRGNSAVVMGEGFFVGEDAPPIHVLERVQTSGAVANLVFDLPKALIMPLCEEEGEDGEEGEEDGTVRFTTCVPHGCLPGDDVYILGIPCQAEGGPFRVAAVSSRRALEVCVRLPCRGGLELALYRPRVPSPQEWARVFPDRWPAFVRTHYRRLQFKVTLAPNAVPICGPIRDVILPAGTGIRTLDGAFRGVLATDATTSECTVADAVVLVEAHTRRVECNEVLELMPECGGGTAPPLCDPTFFRVVEPVVPFATAACPQVVWCANAGVFEASVHTDSYARGHDVQPVVARGLEAPYGIYGPAVFGAPPVRGGQDQVPSTARMNIEAGFYQAAPGVGAALSQAINPPTLGEEMELVFETSAGEQRRGVGPGTFSPRAACAALQAALAPHACVSLTDDCVILIESDDPFFVLDVAYNPWLAAFGFDPTGCNGLCSRDPIDTRAPLHGVYGVRVAPTDAGTLSVLLERGAVRGTIEVRGGQPVLILRHATHLGPGDVVRLGNTFDCIADGRHVIQEVCVGDDGHLWEIRLASRGVDARLSGSPVAMRADVDSFSIFATNIQYDSGGVTGFQTDQLVGRCHTADAPVIVPPSCTILIRINGISGQVNTLARTGTGERDYQSISSVAAVELSRERPGTCVFPTVVSASCPNGARNGVGCYMRDLEIELLTPNGQLANFHGADHTIVIRIDQL